jgi:hypothetical protein
MGKVSNVSYRFGIEPDHGVGIIENTGASWLWPELGVSAITVFDTDGQPHTLMLDQDGYAYDISGREGASGGSVSKIWKDKIATDGTGGTVVASSLLFGEDTGEKEHYFQKHLEGHFYFDPYDTSKADTTGYDSQGYPTGLEFDAELYTDGDIVTLQGQTKDIRKTGDLVLDKEVESHRMQWKLKSNMGEHIVKGRTTYYEAMDKPADPDNLVDTEMDHQSSLSGFDCNVAPMVDGSILDRGTGNAIVVSGTVAQVSDPSGNANALSFSGSSGLNITLNNYTGDCTISFMVDSTISFPCTIFSTNGLSISITKSGAIYSVNWNDGINSKTQALTWDGTGWCMVSIVRSGTSLIFREGL